MPVAATVAYAAHSMASAHVAHGVHSMKSAKARSKARAMADTSCSSHSGAVASAHVLSALAMNRRAFAMDHVHLLRMRRCVA